MFDIRFVPGKRFKTIEANHVSNTWDLLALLFGGNGTHSADKQKPSNAQNEFPLVQFPHVKNLIERVGTAC